jgi:hypothetical protein
MRQKIGSLVAVVGLLAASPALAGPAASNGIASNRAALGLPIGQQDNTDCTPTQDHPCTATDDSGGKSHTGTLLVALGAIAAVGAGIAAAAQHGNHPPVSP